MFFWRTNLLTCYSKSLPKPKAVHIAAKDRHGVHSFAALLLGAVLPTHVEAFAHLQLDAGGFRFRLFRGCWVWLAGVIKQQSCELIM